MHALKQAHITTAIGQSAYCTCGHNSSGFYLFSPLEPYQIQQMAGDIEALKHQVQVMMEALDALRPYVRL